MVLNGDHLPIHANVELLCCTPETDILFIICQVYSTWINYFKNEFQGELCGGLG